MIKRHDFLKAAPNDTVIWHYMSVAKFIYLLKHRQLYFGRMDSFEDKAEVLVSDIEKNYWRKELKNNLEPWIEHERKKVFINCWIKSDIEHSTMWSAYASQGTGVAIKTTVDRLIKAYSGEKNITILDVEYIDHKRQTVQPSCLPMNALRYYSTKRIFYEPEHELRLIYETHFENELDFFQIPIDINTLISDLRIGPNTREEVFDMIKTIVPIWGGSFKVLPSESLYPEY